MKENTPKTIYRKDYKPSSYVIETVKLLFQLHSDKTVVVAETAFSLNPASKMIPQFVELDGEQLTLLDLTMNEKPLAPHRFAVNDKTLIIHNPPETFILKITTEIIPESNTSLSGLYKSNGNYCTQCEAEGFRRITYYLDRPDVLAVFTTRIEADGKKCPVLLSNGNLVEKGMLPNGKHYATWHDPFAKPCYLFALVAGDLACREDKFITRSGKQIDLQFFVEHKNKAKCDHAMNSLKKAMRWDEQTFGLEYDLEKYMIVAVDDFNMGAMENKGLNIFNSKYVLSSPSCATDQDYLGIEGVIGHEYFHNWTGNRVTCRDWFQLSLKEGLTVFRDQEFSADMNSRAVKRIGDAKVMQNSQFREDSGPMAHPVRPDLYVEINNFYTVTVYNKGAEVIRMLAKIIGWQKFKEGMTLYCKRYDGQAVTCEDFVNTMSDAAGVDLQQFKLWYSQSGTPVLEVEEQWLSDENKYVLTIRQNCQPTPGQMHKLPFHIPVEIGLLNKTHNSPDQQEQKSDCLSRLLHVKEPTEHFEFRNFKEKPVLSFLRDFSAPVKIKKFHNREDLIFLMAHDDNPYNRWDAAFSLSTDIILEVMQAFAQDEQPVVDQGYIDSFAACLDHHADKALAGLILTLPEETYLAQQLKVIEPDLLHRAALFVRQQLAMNLKEKLKDAYMRCNDGTEYSISPGDIGKRSLKNCVLYYLMTPTVYDAESKEMCLGQFTARSNMTDVVAALACLVHIDEPEREESLAAFYQEWKDDSLVIDKWLSLQAVSTAENVLDSVKKLMGHPSFSRESPNKVRSLIGVFCTQNHFRFHHHSGAGYRFLSEQIISLDLLNPQIAARLMSPLISYAKYTQKLKVMMEEQIWVILNQRGLSDDVYEIAEKCLNKKK